MGFLRLGIGTSYTGASVAVNGFYSSGNVEGEMLSASGILCPARQAFLAPSLRRPQKFHKTLFISSLPGIVGVGGSRNMFLVHEPNALFLYHCSEKLGKTSRAAWGSGKEIDFVLNQAWV
jgi:hypothetical protein